MYTYIYIYIYTYLCGDRVLGRPGGSGRNLCYTKVFWRFLIRRPRGLRRGRGLPPHKLALRSLNDTEIRQLFPSLLLPCTCQVGLERLRADEVRTPRREAVCGPFELPTTAVHGCDTNPGGCTFGFPVVLWGSFGLLRGRVRVGPSGPQTGPKSAPKRPKRPPVDDRRS